MMERLRKSLSAIPSWIFTILTVIAILWLTLSPKPLGEESPKLFPGADKVAHGIMFGGLTLMLLLDWQRRHLWKPVIWVRALICAVSSSIFGILIEIIQLEMNLGRGFEYEDMIADTIGSFIIAILWMCFQDYWDENISNKIKRGGRR